MSLDRGLQRLGEECAPLTLRQPLPVAALQHLTTVNLQFPNNSEHSEPLPSPSGRGTVTGLLPLLLALLSFGFCGTASCQKVYSQHIDPYPVKMVVPVTMANGTHPFILSLGTYRVHLDASLGHLLGETHLPPGTTNRPEGGKGKVFDGVELALDKWTFTPRKMATTDFTDFNANALGNFEGVLGLEALQGHTLSLDFDRQTLEIYQTFHGAPPEWERVHLGDSDVGVVTAIQVRVNGELLQFLLDTGVGSAIGFTHETFEKFKAAGVIEGSDMVGKEGGIGQESKETRWGTLTNGEVLGLSLKGMPVVESDNYNVLGLSFLVNFNLIFDLKEGWLYYRRRECEPPIFADAMLGMGLVREGGKLMVGSVATASAATEAGIRVGDQIVRLGKLDADSIDERSKYRLCLQSAGHEMTVELLREGHAGPLSLRLNIPQKMFQFPSVKGVKDQ